MYVWRLHPTQSQRTSGHLRCASTCKAPLHRGVTVLSTLMFKSPSLVVMERQVYSESTGTGDHLDHKRENGETGFLSGNCSSLFSCHG